MTITTVAPAPLPKPEFRIIGFLQNQWFHDPKRVRESIASQPPERREAFRHAFAIRALFAGCLTGRRLRSCLGDQLCHEIYWENASLEMGDQSSAVFSADIPHIKRVIEQQNAHLVVAFGRVATEALLGLVATNMLLIGPHPAARGTETVRLLRELAAEIERRKL